MEPITTLTVDRWQAQPAPEDARFATQELESGKVVFLPHLGFALTQHEQVLLSPAWGDDKAKNVSFDPVANTVRHTSAPSDQRELLSAMMMRFAQQSRELVTRLCPRYARDLRSGLTSFRPVEARGRASSRRKDDTRLHVDAFASRPNQGARILRVFCNINPHGSPRVWELGEPFDSVAQRFYQHLPPQWPGSTQLLQWLHVTKGPRTAYDHIMLKMHDKAKLDDGYQQTAPRMRFEFPAPSTWIVFTDRVMHAALAGQFVLEQTFYVPVTAMLDEERAPLRILEKLFQRRLA